MTTPPITQLDREALSLLVHTFYERVRDDAMLQPIFDLKIAPDAWPRHLERMTDFWSSVLLGSQTYVGQPMAKHAALVDAVPDFGAPYFKRWLELFETTTRGLFAPHLADEVMLRARNMGAGLLRAVKRQSSYSVLDSNTLESSSQST